MLNDRNGSLYIPEPSALDGAGANFVSEHLGMLVRSNIWRTGREIKFAEHILGALLTTEDFIVILPSTTEWRKKRRSNRCGNVSRQS
jgi:hypothetical protein